MKSVITAMRQFIHGWRKIGLSRRKNGPWFVLSTAIGRVDERKSKGITKTKAAGPSAYAIFDVDRPERREWMEEEAPISGGFSHATKLKRRAEPREKRGGVPSPVIQGADAARAGAPVAVNRGSAPSRPIPANILATMCPGRGRVRTDTSRCRGRWNARR